MRDNPLIVSLLIGLIVVLVIAGVSLLVKMNTLDRMHKEASAKSIGLEKTIQELKAEKSGLLNTIKGLKKDFKDAKAEYETNILELKEENLKLEKLKEKLEDNLKDELTKQKIEQQ
tara:strand:- start:114 stop:461 length:348 start_codon:yes stop_codon:yes gene_type:complete